MLMPEQFTYREMAKYARSTVRDCMKMGRKSDGHFESVWILFNETEPSCETFSRMVEQECWRVGAHTIVESFTSERSKLSRSLTPDESLSEINPISTGLASIVDATMFIGGHDNPSWASGVADKVKLGAPTRTKVNSLIDERKVKWLYFGWPLPSAAKAYHVGLQKFRRIFFNSIRASFSKKTLRLVKYYKQALHGKKEVRVTAEDGTDLVFEISGRPILMDDGILSKEDIETGATGLNIPSGEAFVAPLETTANGKLKLDESFIEPFGKVRGLTAHFQEGKIVDFKAVSGGEAFRKFLDSNTGDKDRIAELGIGCNAGAEYTGGSIIIDEKIYGTIHIAVGNNEGIFKGTNKASSHLDLVKDMRRGNLYADGELIMRNGIPTNNNTT